MIIDFVNFGFGSGGGPRKKFCPEIFRFDIDYRRNYSQMIKDGRYAYVDPYLCKCLEGQTFPVQVKFQGRVALEAAFFESPLQMETVNEDERKSGQSDVERDWRFASIEYFLAFGYAFRDDSRGRSVTCVGSSFKMHQLRHVACIERTSRGDELLLERVDHVYGSFLLAYRKVAA